MKTKSILILLLATAGSIVAEIPPSINTPDKVESSLGTLEYKDGRAEQRMLNTRLAAATASLQETEFYVR